MDIITICKSLKCKGELKSYEILSNGNINTTYHIITADKTNTYEYLLQRINKNVFKDPVRVMQNIASVTNYIYNNKSNSCIKVLTFNTTEDGEPYLIDEIGNFWRAREYLDCVSFNTTDNLFVIKEAGYAFGEFQHLLDGYDASNLFESIPNFHNTKKRIENLEKAILYSKGSRKQNCQNEIDYILSNKEISIKLVEMLKNGELPLRVTHNDTKCNNVIFDKDTHKAISVIDLDTIMGGLTAYDFGDGARSICSTVEEDESDLSKVKFDLSKFEAFTEGYLSPLKSTLTKNEIESLGISVYIMTIELASRFLEDYLNGDVYFIIKYPEQNLRRARCQIALCKDIMAKIDKINEIIIKYSK